MPLIRATLWFGLLALAAAALIGMGRASLVERVPHCAAEDARELLVQVLEAELSSEEQGRSLRPRLRLDVLVQQDADPECVDLAGRQLRLSWYSPPQVAAGEVWRVAAEVRPPWGFQNPGGFDYERLLLARGLDGAGYIRFGRRHAAAVPDVRRRLRTRIAERTAHLARSAHLRALASGDSSALEDADWSLLRRTGTVHLLVVSGLHVGLVALLAYWVGAGVARCAPGLLLWAPAGWLAGACSLVAVAAFVWLCGATVPALRAGVMGALGVLAVLGGRRAPVALWFALAALVVICAVPEAVLTQGFWLSFGAVAALIAGFANRHPAPGWLSGLLRAQFIMLFAMTPLTAVAVGETAPLAGVANLIAVPWISFVAVPLVMLSLLATILGLPCDGVGWTLADWSLGALLAGLQALDGGAPHLTPSTPWQGLGAALAFVCLLGAPSWRLRLACLPLWAAAFLVLEERPAEGTFQVRALDVGQGSALLVDTRRHRLLYDAGARFPSGFDLGEAVVLPAIAASGPSRLHRLIISHGDLDHVGGAAAVLRGVPTASVLSNVPGLNGQPCLRGRRWSWDGVHFAILHPRTALGPDGNDRSCVLEITAGAQRALLTGDISRSVEAELVAHGLRPATLLLAPHHGSNSSSSRDFIEAVNPDLVFISAGWRNRYRHPHPAVVRRYGLLGAELWRTGADGALLWSSQRPGQVRAQRRERLGGPAWWVNQPPPAISKR